MAGIIHPTLGQLLPLDSIPNEIEALKDALQSIFDDIYVTNLIVSKGFEGHYGFYSLTLTTYNSIGINLPIGDDFNLVINPSIQGTTQIPVKFDYSWLIIRYIKNFSLDSFDNSVRSILHILFDLSKITPEILLREAISGFYTNSEFIVDFINDFNTQYNQNISTDLDDTLTYDQQIDELAHQIEQLDINILEVIFQMNIDIGDGLENLKILFRNMFSKIGETINEVIKLNFRISIDELSAGLQFPRKWLIPVYTNNLPPIPNVDIDDPLPEGYYSVLKFNVATLEYSSIGGFKFEKTSSVELNRSMIGTTGLIVEFAGLKIDLSRDSNIPEANIDNRPENFMGVYASKAAITLPKNWFNNVDNTTLQVVGRNLLIGTGGVSGTVALETVGGDPTTGDQYLNVNIGNWELGFNYFDITFKQNDITSSNIRAKLMIPKFTKPNGDDAEIEVVGHLEANGDFKLTASTTPPYPTIEFGNIFKLHLKSAELGREEDDFYIGAAADIEFKGLLAGLLEGQGITIGAAIRIYSNGRIDFKVDGGSLVLPKTLKLKIGPVELSVSAIHFGSHEREKEGQIRKYNYFGFDAGVSLGMAGIDARGDGVKFYYTVDDGPSDSYLHIQTIHVDMVIPANSNDPSVMINGWLSIPEPGESSEFAGGVGLKVKNPRVAGNVEMRLSPKYPAFLLDAGIELPNPIPLGPVSIYGFKGLLGYRYVAEKEAIGMTSENTWYEYYSTPIKGVGIEKFSGPEQTESYSFPFSLGVGGIIGDTMAAGNIISANAMLLLSLPSMVMVDARMKLLSKRATFTDDPPFFAFFIFGDDSLEFGFGADYKFPESSGDIIKIYAEVQLGFFFNNPPAWYINFGTRENPISAKLLKDIFSLKAFLMMSGSGIEAGARGEFRFDRKYGPVSIMVLAYLELGGRISFERPQIGGYFEAGLAIDINVKVFRIYASVSILLAVESPKPFLIYGAFKVKFKIKVLFFKIKFSTKVELKWEFNKQVDRSPVNPFTELSTQEDGLVKGISMLTGESFELANLKLSNGSIDPDLDKIRTKVVPLDTYIDLKTTKGLVPNHATGSPLGGISNPPDQYTDLVPPKKVMKGLELRQVKHRYSIEHLEIMAYSQTMGWQPYHPYVALYPNDTESGLDELPVGHWQKKDQQYNAVRLMATTPFSYTELGEPGWFIPELYGLNPSTLFCEGETIKHSISDFLAKLLYTKYYASDHNYFHSKGIAFQIDGETELIVNPDNSTTLTGDFGEVTDEYNVFGFDQSLQFPNHTSLIMMLPEPSAEIELKLSTYSSGVHIEYFKPLIDDTASFVQYESIALDYLTREELQSPIYKEFAPIDGVTKIIITPDDNDMDLIQPILDQMAVLMEEGYQMAWEQGGAIREVLPKDPKKYEELKRALANAKTKGCLGITEPKDERACEIFPTLIQSYNNDFEPPFEYNPGKKPDEREEVIIYANFIQRNQQNYEKLKEVFKKNTLKDSAYLVNLALLEEALAALQNYLKQNPKLDYDQAVEVLRLFEPVKTKTKQLIGIVRIKRDCRNQVLCDLSESLSFQNFGEFLDKPPISRSPLLEAYFEFIDQNPQFEYLNTILAYQINIIRTIVNGGRRAFMEHEQEYIEACEQMIAIIFDLGNCQKEEKCFTLFHEISWLTVEDYQYNIEIPGQEAISQDTQAAVDGINKYIQPVWRPDTSYFVRFKLRDEVDNGQGEGVFEYAYGFHTAGPVGFFHLDAHSPYGTLPMEEIDQYPHTSLRAYIDYDRSYPNADGNLISAKPLFYDDSTTEISLYFTSRYAIKLLEGWEAVMDGNTLKFPKLGGTMKIIIKDPLEDVEIVNPPRLDTDEENIMSSTLAIPQTIEKWEEDEHPQIPPELQKWFDLLNDENCTGIIDTIKPKSFFRKVTPKRLKPQKLYTAQVLNFYWGDQDFDISDIDEDMKVDFAREVHKFIFQTSRYRNFKEQIESCIIEYDGEDGTPQTKPAVYVLEKALEEDHIQAALDILKKESNSLSEKITQQFLDPFDRIVEGLFALPPLEKAVTTEFTKIIDLSTSKVVGVLIRSPEPFNHPRIPMDEVIRQDESPGMIEILKSNSNAIDDEYFWLFSKDYSQALVMNNAKSIQAVNIKFQFIYKTWDGNEYINADSQTITVKIN